MARRARSSVNPLQILIGVILLAALFVGGYFLLGRRSQPLSGLTDLDVIEYQSNANSLRGNKYRLRGRVDERLDEWRASEGRVFSIEVIHDGGSSLLPVQFPPSLNSENIQRGQEVLLKVLIGDDGLPIAEEVRRI